MEPWGQFGKGWSFEKVCLEMTEPTYMPMVALPHRSASASSAIDSILQRSLPAAHSTNEDAAALGAMIGKRSESAPGPAHASHPHPHNPPLTRPRPRRLLLPRTGG